MSRCWTSRCAVLRCTNTSQNCLYSFFALPHDTKRAQEWVMAIHREDLLDKLEHLNKGSYKICGMHFENKMFLNDLRNRLHKDAIPTNFPQLQKKSDKQSLSFEAGTNKSSQPTNTNVLRQDEIKTEVPDIDSTYVSIPKTESEENYLVDSSSGVLYQDGGCIKLEPDASNITLDNIEDSIESYEIACMLPGVQTKSDNIYETAYQKFLAWCKEKNSNDYSESVFLAYFSEIATKMKSSTMWSQYSMLKSLLNSRNGVDISKYLKLRAYLKKQNEGYIPTKSKVFTKEQFDKFIFEAWDEFYLGMKIILVVGIFGACRCDELVKMKIDDIEDLGSLIQIKIPDSETNKTRSFTIVGDTFINIYRKYANLRPKGMNERRFFLKYVNGKCHRSVMGVHKIGDVPRQVASYLKLPDWEEYTGHCLRRTSATLLADGYVDEPLSNRKEIATEIVLPNSNLKDDIYQESINEGEENSRSDILHSLLTCTNKKDSLIIPEQEPKCSIPYEQQNIPQDNVSGVFVSVKGVPMDLKSEPMDFEEPTQDQAVSQEISTDVPVTNTGMLENTVSSSDFSDMDIITYPNEGKIAHRQTQTSRKLMVVAQREKLQEKIRELKNENVALKQKLKKLEKLCQPQNYLQRVTLDDYKKLSIKFCPLEKLPEHLETIRSVACSQYVSKQINSAEAVDLSNEK